MPELPEMQALAERLDDALANSVVIGVQPLQFSALKTVVPEPNSIIGRQCSKITRRGKYLVFRFAPEGDEGDRCVLIHLSQGGRVDVESPAKATKPNNGVMRMTFDTEDKPTSVFIKEFGHERRASWWVLANDDLGPLVGLGPDIDTPEADAFLRTSTDARRVHTILRDQRTLAGLGRGYSNDALHKAMVSPYASLASLDANERERLVEAIKFVLENGLEHERKRKGGLPPKVGDHWIVHHRKGEPCPNCGDTLRWISYESYEVTYCPRCQTDGKVLADRRMSRLLR